MRIVRLTPAVEKKLLYARQEHDAEAERIASKIVGDIRRRGDVALSAWVKKLDDVDLRNRVGAQGRQRVVDNWSWKHTAFKTLEQYRALLAESGR